MLSDEMTLGGLFLSALLSSTFFPGGSEVVLAALVAHNTHDPWVLLLVATGGNTIGSMITWGMGWMVKWWYPLSRLSKRLDVRAVSRLQQWGSPALLFAWLPLVGDPLCFAAGWLGMHGLMALVYIAIGKAARYAVIVWAMW